MEIRYYGDKISEHIAKTPEGFLICQDVPISRTGYQSYLASEIMENPKDGHRVIHVYRPASEVFNEKSLASFEGKPVCNEHPQEDITPENFHKFACGHVQNVHMGEGADSNKVLADLYITDPVLIRLIKDGKREISCGYYAEEKRDSAGRLCQTKIRGNHVAVVNSARAGKSVCIRDHNTTGKRNRLSLDGYDSPRHSLLSLGDRWLTRLKPTRREMRMSRYYNSYFDDDEELEALEDDDILEEEDVLEDDDDVLEEEDVLEDDDDILEEEDALEDDDDILVEEDYEDDDDVLEEDIEDDDDLDDFEDAFYNDIDLGAIGGAIKNAGGAIKNAGKKFAGGFKASGVNASKEALGKMGVAAKSGRALGKGVSAVRSGANKAAAWAKNNPGKAAAIGAGAGAGAGFLAGRKSKDSWYPYYDEDFEDASYNDGPLGAIASGIKAGAKGGFDYTSGLASAGTKIGKAGRAVAGAAKNGAKAAGRGVAKGAEAAGHGIAEFGRGVRSGIKGKLGKKATNLSTANKAGRAVGGALRGVGKMAASNPGKTAAVAGAGLGAGVALGRASKDSWYPYNDGYYWDDDVELTGIDDIGVEDEGDIDEEELTIEQKADSILRDARRVLRDAKRKLRRSDAIILSDDDDELKEEVSEDIEDDDDVLEEEETVEDGCYGDDDAEAYGEQFDDDDDEPVDESEEIDVDKTQALRDITEATRGISDPHERKNVQDAVYGALCGRSQMADIMRVTRGNRNARMDSLFGTRGQMSVAGQQAIYDSFNPHKG